MVLLVLFKCQILKQKTPQDAASFGLNLKTNQLELWREKYAHLFLEDNPVDWTPILETTRISPCNTVKLIMLLDVNFHFKLLQERQYTKHKAPL